MYSLLLVVIYLAFISLGLPDSLVGSAWPIMHTELSVPVSFAGIITMIIAGGTIVSSLLSDRLTKKLGAGLITAGSVLLTAIALFGFSLSGSFLSLCLWAIPYGLGAGAIDAALNNYVALHYASRHMSWLHCFWGVGATISPYIMSHYLTNGSGWKSGYRTIGLLQIIVTILLFISLPLWKNRTTANPKETSSTKVLRLPQILKIRGVPFILITFFSYCALEQTTMLWASSYLVKHRGLEPAIAASFASLFFIGITVGRFLCGCISDKLGDKRLIRIGIATSVVGILGIALPLKTDVIALAGFVIIGFGCAPIYPSIIHSTPFNFGKENSQAIIGVQMASAYLGSTLMPPLFGLIVEHSTIGLLPLYLICFSILMLLISERLNKIVLNKYE